MKEMVEKVAWLGEFVALHTIGEYAFVEYHPRTIGNARNITDVVNREQTAFAAFIDGKHIHESFVSLDDALMGVIAYKFEGPNHRADQYFMMALSAIKEFADQTKKLEVIQ